MRRNFIAALAAVLMFAMTAGSALALNYSENAVASPYWQADSGVYTFVGITHPSMSGLATSVGLVVSPLLTDGATPTGTSALEFTVTAGTTTKVFIVLTNNTSINPTNIPTAKFVTILSTTGQSGPLFIQPKASNPELAIINEITAGPLGRTDGGGRRAAELLNVWGAVVVQSTSTGFAMEFVGDSHTSFYVGSVAPSLNQPNSSNVIGSPPSAATAATR